MPWFANLISIREKHGEGFGVDYDVWHWTIFATILAIAESLSYDDDKMKKADKESVKHPAISPERQEFVIQQVKKMQEKAKKRRGQ